MHLVVLPFDSDRTVRVGVPEAGGREVQGSVTLLEDGTIADEFESALLGVEGFDHLVRNGVGPGLSFFLVVGLAFQVLLNYILDDSV